MTYGQNPAYKVAWYRWMLYKFRTMATPDFIDRFGDVEMGDTTVRYALVGIGWHVEVFE